MSWPRAFLLSVTAWCVCRYGTELLLESRKLDTASEWLALERAKFAAEERNISLQFLFKHDEVPASERPRGLQAEPPRQSGATP